MITKDEIRAKVSSNPLWAERAIAALYERQTATEKAIGQTVVLNGIGFNGADADILSSFGLQIQRGRRLSPKQLAIAFKKLPKYAGQLLRIAQEKAGIEDADKGDDIGQELDMLEAVDEYGDIQPGTFQFDPYIATDGTVIIAEQRIGHYDLHEFETEEQAIGWCQIHAVIPVNPGKVRGRKNHCIDHVGLSTYEKG